MADLLDDQTVNIPCGGYGQEIPETIRNLKTNPEIIYPGCGALTRFKPDDFAAGVQDAEKRIADVERSIRDIFK